MLKYFYIFSLMQITIFASLNAMEKQQEENFYSIILPGQNGGGGEFFLDDSLVTTDKSKIYKGLLTDSSKIDLGQGNCIKHFKEQFSKDKQKKNSKLLLYGISQGTATLINWLAQKTHQKQEKKIGCLVLEAVLGSGNSGIMHTIESHIPSFITFLPFARFWLPWIAKVAFPTYNPLGKQALASAKKLSPHIPIIIMHNKGDIQLSINDARQLYCILRNNGNDAYLLETDNKSFGGIHFNILHYDKDKHQKIWAIQEIYKKHNLPYKKSLTRCTKNNMFRTEYLEDNKVDLSEFQPSVKTVQQRINESSRLAYWTRNSIDFATTSLLGYLAYCYKYSNR